MNYSRIESSVDVQKMHNTHIVVVGAGGSYSLITSLARTGIGKLTVIDFDVVESTNLVRQGYKQSDIGGFKVDALKDEIYSINPEVNYNGIAKSVLDLDQHELDVVFESADVLLFLTDSFKAQAYGNILALKYLKPAIWAGWYMHSRTAELFFQIPNYTTSCFRCAASSRYIANEQEEVKISSSSNTIFHSQLLDSLIGMILLAILHRSTSDIEGAQEKEFKTFFDALTQQDGVITHNFFQFKNHPMGGSPFFDSTFSKLGPILPTFVSYWQFCDAELKTNDYLYDCPDCNGLLHNLTLNPKTEN
jgi:molybdopterin/thiamine biosynthesis adenylyltransferase